MTDLIRTDELATGWIENLALDELNMDESGVINFNEHLDPNILLEESSIDIMNELRDIFEVYATKFNEFRGGSNPSTKIKIFKISNTVNDFMLFRNGLKLIIARKSIDKISVGFLSTSGGLFSARLNTETPAMNDAHEVNAHIGPFNKITWRYMGEEVDLEIMARHYMTEFVRHSSR